MRNQFLKSHLRLLALGSVVFAATLAIPAASIAQSDAPSVAERQRVELIRRAIERLPYYGVYDALSFTIDKGTVTLMGHAYMPALRQDAEEAVKGVAGVDDVVNKIEALPASTNDDRIRRATFYNIYTDAFLSRYSSGGAQGAYYALLDSSQYPGMQPFGNYPVHIIVNHGRTTLMGVVANTADKTMAEVRAREVTGVFGVENQLRVESQTDR